MTILPSDCRAIELTPELIPVPGSKPLSRLPSALSRAILFRLVPLITVKLPPMSNLPSDSTAKESTSPPAPSCGWKATSRLPSALSRAIPPAADAANFAERAADEYLAIQLGDGGNEGGGCGDRI